MHVELELSAVSHGLHQEIVMSADGEHVIQLKKLKENLDISQDCFDTCRKCSLDLLFFLSKVKTMQYEG